MFLPLQNLVSKFSTAINKQKSRINQLDKDTESLSDDIKTLKEKVSSVPNKNLHVEESEQPFNPEVLGGSSGGGQGCRC